MFRICDVETHFDVPDAFKMHSEKNIFFFKSSHYIIHKSLGHPREPLGSVPIYCELVSCRIFFSIFLKQREIEL